MKKKYKLPILLLAMVIMLSIFYIKEANSDNISPADGTNLESSSLNPDFTEARLLALEEATGLIDEWEDLISSGNLDADEVIETKAKIDELKSIKNNEALLEESFIKLNNYDDVLVLLGENYLCIDVYTNNELTSSEFVEIALIAKETFGNDTQIKLNCVNTYE